jgi:hypothetical protein
MPKERLFRIEYRRKGAKSGRISPWLDKAEAIEFLSQLGENRLENILEDGQKLNGRRTILMLRKAGLLEG